MAFTRKCTTSTTAHTPAAAVHLFARSHTHIGTLQPVSVSVRAFRNGQRGLTNSVRSETRARSLSNKPAERHRHTFQTIFKVNEFQFRGEIQSE